MDTVRIGGTQRDETVFKTEFHARIPECRNDAPCKKGEHVFFLQFPADTGSGIGVARCPDHKGKSQDASVHEGIPELAQRRIPDKSRVRCRFFTLQDSFF